MILSPCVFLVSSFDAEIRTIYIAIQTYGQSPPERTPAMIPPTASLHTPNIHLSTSPSARRLETRSYLQAPPSAVTFECAIGLQSKLPGPDRLCLYFRQHHARAKQAYIRMPEPGSIRLVCTPYSGLLPLAAMHVFVNLNSRRYMKLIGYSCGAERLSPAVAGPRVGADDICLNIALTLVE